MLVFEPQIPLGLWWAMAVLAVAAWAWYALARDTGLGIVRRAIVLTLMAGVLVAPMILLLNPTWIEPIVPPAGKPLVTVLVDATQSMQVDDVDKRTRWQAALEMADQVKVLPVLNSTSASFASVASCSRSMTIPVRINQTAATPT